MQTESVSTPPLPDKPKLQAQSVERTPEQQPAAVLQQRRSSADRLKQYAWKPGQSGNPAGRPKGARQKLAEAFLDGMLSAYEKGGAAAIEAVMKKEPAKFISVLAQIIPKQVEIDGDVNVRVTSAVDSLIHRLEALAKRENEYAKEREQAILTIEHEPISSDAG